ncbi:hypothetical protein PENPOL_c003G06407 [Penicillium polonicum]|uniref:Uncharacterized protein n=1 Tax=Penicillium polonicum TaxID=60169 RepID=A0A1V6NUF9_PENPO|nr:hypothetical protein PENPOL_c003G06407 [Penicillium polonicum]
MSEKQKAPDTVAPTTPSNSQKGTERQRPRGGKKLRAIRAKEAKRALLAADRNRMRCWLGASTGLERHLGVFTPKGGLADQPTKFDGGDERVGRRLYLGDPEGFNVGTSQTIPPLSSINISLTSM